MNKEIQKSINPPKLYIAVSGTAVFFILVMFFLFFHGNRLASNHAPLVNAAMEIKLKATTAHLWFEEVMSGDSNESIDVVWKHIELSDWYARAMLEGGENPEGIFKPLRDHEQKNLIREVRKSLSEFRLIAEKRYNNFKEARPGSAIDQQFDELFHQFIKKTDSVETSIQKTISQELMHYYVIGAFLLFFSVFISIILIRYLIRQENIKAELIKSLSDSHKELEKNHDEIKTNQSDLQESENRLQNVINGARLGYWDWNYQTGEQQVNDRWLEMLGMSRDNINNNVSDWEKLIHPDDKQPILDTIEQSISSQIPYVADFRMKHSDGHWVWIQGSGSVIDSDLNTGQPIRLCGTHQDITLRKKTENALRISEEKLTGLFELSPLGIALTDMEGRFIEFNQSFQNISGYGTDELKAIDYWKLTPEKYKQSEAEQLKSLELTGRYGPYEKEYVVKMVA